MEEVLPLFKLHHINVEVHDERTAGRKTDVSFHGDLRSEQRDAIEQVLAYDHGILCAPTAFGKTVVGACLIAKRAVNALILAIEVASAVTFYRVAYCKGKWSLTSCRKCESFGQIF
jgi:superfamily II DNA or RNA helicase